jgi:putative SOS response-associated peptidase YedK
LPRARIFGRWLDADEKATPPRDLLRPCAAERIHTWPVSGRVGNICNNDASLLDPVSSSQEPLQQKLF